MTITPERIAGLRRLGREEWPSRVSVNERLRAVPDLLDEIERLRAVIRETHRECMTPPHVFSSGSRHAPGCKLYEIEP